MWNKLNILVYIGLMGFLFVIPIPGLIRQAIAARDKAAASIPKKVAAFTFAPL